MNTATTNTSYDDTINLVDVAHDRNIALEGVGLYEESGQVYKLDADGNPVKRLVTVAREGALEDMLLSNKHKVLDVLDITEDPANITEELVQHKKIHNTIDTYSFGGTSIVVDSIQDGYHRIRHAGPTGTLNWMGISFDPSVAPNFIGTNIQYKPPGAGSSVNISFNELIIKAFHEKKAYNKAIGKYLFEREYKRQKQERDDERRARIAARSNSAVVSPGIPENPSTTPSAVANTGPTLNEELSIPQLYSACEQAKKKPDGGSAYSFDKKWFYVRYNKTTNEWLVQYQKDNQGNTDVINKSSIGEVVAEVSTLSKKKEAKTDKPLSVDMGKDFDKNTFVDICDAIGNTAKTPSKKTGYYTLNGHKYAINWDGTQYIAHHPSDDHKGSINHHAHSKDPDPAKLASEVEKVIHGIHEHGDHHVLSKVDFLKLCEKLKNDFNNTTKNPNKEEEKKANEEANRNPTEPTESATTAASSENHDHAHPQPGLIGGLKMIGKGLGQVAWGGVKQGTLVAGLTGATMIAPALLGAGTLAASAALPVAAGAWGIGHALNWITRKSDTMAKWYGPTKAERTLYEKMNPGKHLPKPSIAQRIFNKVLPVPFGGWLRNLADRTRTHTSHGEAEDKKHAEHISHVYHYHTGGDDHGHGH